MLMVICTDAWSCPKSYLLIRKQPLGPSSFLSLKQHSCFLPHLLCMASIRQQHHYAVLFVVVAEFRVTLQTANCAEVGNIYLSSFFIGKWKFDQQWGSPIRWKWISFFHICTVLQLCCFAFSVPFFSWCLLSLCLCCRTCWTLMTHWTLMQQNIIWETRWSFNSFLSSNVDSVQAVLSLTCRWFTCEASQWCLKYAYSLHNHIHTLPSLPA